ncbi:hypothetical protein JXM67_11335 [candidate division WOR-3 bacterium]|nr:hypothetical protein [candidate division WOR-3 bacterium]
MNLPFSTDWWVWIAAICTLAMFSILYRDNPIYRVAEHIFVGLALGYGLSITWHQALWPIALRPLFVEGQLILIIPFCIGLLFFTRIIPKLSWLVRIPIALALGWGSGVSIPRVFRASIFHQMKASLVRPEMFEGSVWPGIWAIILLLGILATLSYFFFSRKEKGPLTPVSKVGIVFIMIGFGATFGLTVMSRISLLIGRVQFLLRDWLYIIPK